MNNEVKKYFTALPEDRGAIIMDLHNLIISMYPDVKIDMSYRMPTYKIQDGWLAIANQKNYVSLYTCGAHHLKEFKEKYPSIKTGKGCINFKVTDTLPISAIKQVVNHAIQYPK